MKDGPMTLDELTQALAAADSDAPLIFESVSGRAGPGYHVTEFKRAAIEAIDCGGQQDAWHEVTLQIRDGQGRDYMSVGKFISIAGRSAAAIEGLARDPIRVEFAAGNDRLELLTVGEPILSEEAVIVPLGARHAVCKPLERARQAANAARCCGTATVAGRCC